MIFFFLKFFLFLNFMLILGHDSVFSMTVASTRTSSFRRSGLPRSVKLSAPTSRTFSSRILSPHLISNSFSIRIRSSAVTFHWWLAKCTTAKSRPYWPVAISSFTLFTTSAWCLVSSTGSGRTTSCQGGELREVLGTYLQSGFISTHHMPRKGSLNSPTAAVCKHQEAVQACYGGA